MSLKNGHDAPEAPPLVSAATQRSRLHRERKRRGVVVLPPIEIAPDMIAALTQLGWLHGIEANNRAAVTGAIGAIVFRALSAGVTPSEKPLLEIDLKAIEAAWPWAKPGSEPTPENAARALGAAVKCAQIVGFGPEVFAVKMRQMLEQRAH